MNDILENKPKFALKAHNNKEKYLFVFVVSFVIFMIVVIPVLIVDKGYMFYYGDFNAQQNMFYDHVQKAAKAGELNYDWGTDLGSSFIGSYAFYLLGSPFFWLTVLFPAGAAPYLIPWLLGVKTAVAAVTSYAYLRRFVKTPSAAVIGSFLYAFSGFQLYNVFFNHFHDVTALFPLLLLALEMAVVDNKKGVFALTVGMMAVVNYFFFAGQVTFLVIYFLCRLFCKDFNINLKKFFCLAFEAVVGVMLAAFMLLPASYCVVENPRVDSMLSGIDMVVYGDKMRLFRIIQSFFMMSDPPARSNLFSSETARWSSMAGYLPMYSMAGVIAFMKVKKKHWAKRLVTICIICALVPFLNTSFYMFNSSYYARWYYMPILIMAMMTALVIEDMQKEGGKLDIKSGIPAVCVVLGICLVIAFLPKENSESEKLEFFKITKYLDLFIVQMSVTVVTLILLLLFVYKWQKKYKKYYYTIICGLTITSVSIVTAANIWYGALQGPYPDKYISQAVNGSEQIDMLKDEFYRLDTSENIDNYCMFWGYSSMRAFQSVVTPSIMEFYIDMGLDRDVASRIDTKYYALRGLLSVKYYVLRKDEYEDKIIPEIPLTGFTKLKETEDFVIYENQNFIPMGFAYDTYITEEEFEEMSTVTRSVALLESLVLTPEQYEKYSDIITKSTTNITTSTVLYKMLCEEKQAVSCKSFEADNDGFSATIDLKKDSLVFFSVPYDKGFSATVNGEKAEIEKVSNGMMAIRVPAGNDNIIRFDYSPYGFKTGVAVSLAGVSLLFIYLGINFALKKRTAKTVKPAKDKSENFSGISEISNKE